MCSSSPVVLSCYSSLGRVHECKTSDYSVDPGYLLVPCHTETTRFQIILSKLTQSKRQTLYELSWCKTYNNQTYNNQTVSKNRH